ncbi:MAG TPA: hypothetical protein PLL06_07340 [Acidobacteriota bacterium]|nr:hypothetical protein [Acidobacteriota bacterium]HNB71108.1 hypothetical protein [Acidobacteriota bacterium]HNC43438.1 hypothetical protein [Acidobacteriota bacterium]HND19751.1 hypothetical protein [Acidobacteriota bacterium]HNG94701.1 hypothetical protein [Acidobacteriota bacterium]
MKNDLNFAPKSTTRLKDQRRPVRDTTARRESARSVSEFEGHRNRAFTVTKPTSTLFFLSFSSFSSFDFGLIRYQNQGTDQYFGRNLGNEA